MDKGKAPCLGCADRTIGCHSVCEKYIIFSKTREEFRKHVQQKKYEEAEQYTIVRRKTALKQKGKWI